MKIWHIVALCVLGIIAVLFAPLVFADAPFTVVCDGGKLSIHTAGVVYRVTGISCARLDDA
jgi:hypothetical protein